MKHADFIVEAVVEDEKVKRSIFQELDKVGTCWTWH
jgi:3-hydroxyacyl-CoA dehydrogenase